MRFRVDTEIPFGNACDIDLDVEGNVLKVGFAPDPHSGPETLWFCLRLVREEDPAPGTPPDASALVVKPGAVTSVRLVLKHSVNMLGGQSPQVMRPVARQEGSAWRRLPFGDVRTLPDGRPEVAWSVPLPASTIDVAYCYPYGMDEIVALLGESRGYWRPDTIGVSQAARPLVRLSNDYGKEGGKRPGLYLMARQHSGETPGSWVLDGFMRHIATLGSDAPLVWAVPLANIDGVEGGDYGKDNFPYDLNRAWGRPPMRHEVSVFERDMVRWRARCRPMLAIDFHAPGACETSGVYAYVPDPDVDRGGYDRLMPWATWTAEALTSQYAAEDFPRVARYPSRWETPSFRTFAWSQLGVPCITYETSYAMAGERVLTREDYREIGRRIAQGVLHGLDVLG